MEKAVPQTPAPDTPADAAPAPARRPLLARLLVVLLVAIVVVVECAADYLCIPSATDPATLAGGTPKPAAAKKADHDPKAKGKGKEKAEGDDGETPSEVEIDLGEFSVTAFQPASNTTLRIDFHLFGSVGAENEKEFRRLMDDNKHRFREQVLMTVRSAEMSDMTDASLGLIKRTILDKARHILGKPLLREVIVSEFSFIEQ
jgi:flagellar FliL protein